MAATTSRDTEQLLRVGVEDLAKALVKAVQEPVAVEGGDVGAAAGGDDLSVHGTFYHGRREMNVLTPGGGRKERENAGPCI